MAGRPRMRKSITGRLRLDPESYARHKAQLKGLERAVRKEIIEAALMAGGLIVHAAAEAKAPGKLAIRIVGGRTLRKRVDPRMAAIVKANGKFCAIGPDKKHWYYRFFEFGATKHDIKPNAKKAIAFEADGKSIVTRRARGAGGVRMKPFLRPAVDSNADAATGAMGDVLAREIEKAAQT